jgi:hypothetical protein
MVSDKGQYTGKVPPYRHSADAFLQGYLFVAISFVETHAKDTPVLLRQRVYDIIHHIGKLVIRFLMYVVPGKRNVQQFLSYGLVPQAFQTTVPDAFH